MWRTATIGGQGHALAGQGPVEPSESQDGSATAREDQGGLSIDIDEVYTVPTLRNNQMAGDQSAGSRPALEGEPLNVTIPPQPLPSFVNTVFGEILELPFALGPGVSERTEVLTLRSVRNVTPEAFLGLVEQTLADYGTAVVYEDGLFRVLARDSLAAGVPEFVRARSRPDVPSQLRPVVQFIQLDAIDSADMEAILRQAFPDAAQLRIQTRRDVNALTLTGLSDDVELALSLVERMDNLRFAGQRVVAITPENWEPTDLANTISEILTLEGFVVGVGARVARPITLLPLPFTGQIMIFAANNTALAHVIDTAQRLDEAAATGEVKSAHVYDVRHANAEDLAGVVAGVLDQLSGDDAPSATPAPNSGDGSASARLSTDTIGNRIVFVGTTAEFAQVRDLLERLDTPIGEVLIEVTIAEVTLNDQTDFGIEFLMNTFGGDVTLQTAGGLGLASGGLSAVIVSGDVDLFAGASATNSQINVLSTPRVVARSGSEATVQVGSDVPIITTQRAANSEFQGSTDVLQTIQYRSTGVLLSVAPRVYSGDRIDLTISQEVSSATANPNQAIASPIISNRLLTSELTLQDGQTAVLGGLMENRFDNGQTGVPWAKDIPVFGRLFRTETLSTSRTVLLILVTPYLLDNSSDRARFVDYLTGQVNDAFVAQLRPSGTLYRPDEPMVIRRSGSPH